MWLLNHSYYIVSLGHAVYQFHLWEAVLLAHPFWGGGSDDIAGAMGHPSSCLSVVMGFLEAPRPDCLLQEDYLGHSPSCFFNP